MPALFQGPHPEPALRGREGEGVRRFPQGSASSAAPTGPPRRFHEREP